jgi:hypothetical protein
VKFQQDIAFVLDSNRKYVYFTDTSRLNKMEESQNSADLINTICDMLSYLPISTKPDIKYKPMPDPLSVYVPLDSLTEETINSLVSTVQHAAKVRKWLVDKDQCGNIQELNWDELRATYDKVISEKDDGLARKFDVEKYEPYYELTIEGVSSPSPLSLPFITF